LLLLAAAMGAAPKKMEEAMRVMAVVIFILKAVWVVLLPVCKFLCTDRRARRKKISGHWIGERKKSARGPQFPRLEKRERNQREANPRQFAKKCFEPPTVAQEQEVEQDTRRRLARLLVRKKK